MYNKWSLNIFSELYIFTYQRDMYSKTGKKKISKARLKNCCSLRIKLSSILYGCTAHVWEEVDIFIETSSTAVTCFYFQNLNKNCWKNMLLQKLCFSVLPVHWVSQFVLCYRTQKFKRILRDRWETWWFFMTGRERWQNPL